MQLPKNTHPHDKNWIISQIQQLPARLRHIAIQGYDAEYTEAHTAEKVEHAKENAARRAANTRLRLYVKKVISAR
jgi:hypothetical protein